MGGGTCEPAATTYGRGRFHADDMARTGVLTPASTWTSESQGSTTATTFVSGAQGPGFVRSGDVGAHGVSSAPGALDPVRLQVTLDTVVREPPVSHHVLDGDNSATAVARRA